MRIPIILSIQLFILTLYYSLIKTQPYQNPSAFISRSYPVTFGLNDQYSLVMTSGAFFEFDSHTNSMKYLKSIKGESKTEGNGIEIRQNRIYAVKRSEATISEEAYFSISIEDYTGITLYIFPDKIAYTSDIVSMFRFNNKNYAAWIYHKVISFASFREIGSITRKDYATANFKSGSNIDCQGFTHAYACVYTNEGSSSPVLANNCYLHLFQDDMTEIKTQYNLLQYECMNSYGLKLYRMNPAQEDMIICSIGANLSIYCMTGTIMAGSNEFSPTELNKIKEIIQGCTQLIYNFSIGKFHSDYGIVCSNGDKIKIQRINYRLDYVGPLIEVTKTDWNVVMPSLVYFTNTTTGLFYGNSKINGGIGYHMFAIPTCTNSYIVRISTNNDQILNFTPGIGTYYYTGIYLQFMSLIEKGVIRVINPEGDVQLYTNYDVTNLRYYASNIGGDFLVTFKIVNEEGFSSSICHATFKVKQCYSSCYGCDLESTDPLNHNCTKCLNGYYRKELDKNYNCYNNDTIPINYFLTLNSAKEYWYAKCDESCLNCAVSQYSCITCSSNYFWKSPDKRECSRNLQYHYIENGIWMPCYKSCENCKQGGNITNHNCTTCKIDPPHYHVIDMPIDYCSTQEEYPNYFYNTTSQQWEPCYATCGLCTQLGVDSKHKCTSCIQGTSYKCDIPIGNSNCFNFSSTDRPINTYFDPKSQTYKQCDGDCISCTGPKQWTNPNCIVCRDKNEYQNGGFCKKNCPSNMYHYTDRDGFSFCLTSCPEDTKISKKEVIGKDKLFCEFCLHYIYKHQCYDFIENVTDAVYLYDEDRKILRKCQDNCLECQWGGNILENNCTVCKANYIPFEDHLTNCGKHGNEYNGYYEDINMFKRCYGSCNTCVGLFDQNLLVHNCKTCASGYVVHPNPNYNKNCVKRCPHYWYIENDYDVICTDKKACPTEHCYLIPINNQCVKACDKYVGPIKNIIFYQYNGECNQNCPANSIGTKIDRQCHDLTNVDDLIQSIPNIIKESPTSNQKLFGYDKMFHLCSTEAELYQRCIHDANQYKFSIIDMNSCLNKLRGVYSLNDKDPLFIATFDLETEYLSTQLEYLVYDKDGNRLDLEYCKNIEILTYKPIAHNDILNKANLIFKEYGYNILNSSDPFYLDICYPITSDNNTDVLLKDRFDYFYSNFSFCEDGCSLIDFDLVIFRATCKCSCNSNIILQPERIFVVEQGSKKGKDSTLQFFKCDANVFTLSVFEGNIGHYVTLIIFVFQSGILIYFFLEGQKGIFSFLNRHLNHSSNPPRKVNEILNSIQNGNDKEIDSIDFSNDDYNANNDIYYAHDINTKIRYANDASKKASKEYAKAFIMNQNYFDTKIDDMLDNTKHIEENSKSIKISHNNTIKDEQANSNLDSSKVNNVVIEKIHIPNSNKRNSESESESSARQILAPLKSKDESLVKKLKDIKEENVILSDKGVSIYKKAEVFFKQRIKKYEKMSFCFLYIYFIRKKHRFISVLFEKGVYDIRCIKISLLILSITLDVLLSTLFCFNSLISDLFTEQTHIDFPFVITFGGVISLIGYIIMKIVSWSMEFKSLIINLLKNKHNSKETFSIELKKQIHRLKVKFILYFSFLLVFIALVWYTATAFCGTFINTQFAWGIMIAISIFISFIIPMIYYFLIVIFLYNAIKCKSPCLFGCSKCALKL